MRLACEALFLKIFQLISSNKIDIETSACNPPIQCKNYYGNVLLNNSMAHVMCKMMYQAFTDITDLLAAGILLFLARSL